MARDAGGILTNSPALTVGAVLGVRAGRPSSPVAALVAAQVSATAGSPERDGGDLVLGEARWRKENGFLGPLANLGPRRYSSAASVPSLTGADGSSRRPGRVLTPHPGASSCPASRLLESRRVGDGIAWSPTGLVLLLVRPGRSERSTHENVGPLRVCRPRL